VSQGNYENVYKLSKGAYLQNLGENVLNSTRFRTT